MGRLSNKMVKKRMIREKMKQTKKEKWIGIGILIITFLLIHIIIKGNYGDDLIFLDKAKSVNLLNYLNGRYHRWSSRIIIEFFMLLVLRLPIWVWRIIDILMIFLCFYCMRYLCKTNDYEYKHDLVLALLISIYPFMHMGSAGFMVTTINYLCPLSLGLYAITGLKKSFTGEYIRVYEYILYTVSLVFSCNGELTAIMNFACFGAVFIERVYKKEAFRYALLGTIISIVSIIFIMTTPGNAHRNAVEIKRHMPRFLEMSIIDKLRLGLVSTFEHYISIPNVILFLLCVLICVEVWMNTKSILKRVVASIPLIIDLVGTGYVCVFYIIRQGKLNYLAPSMKANAKQYVLCGIFLLMILCIMFSLYWIIQDKVKCCIVFFILGIGFATRMALAFSPTLLASGTRTFMLLYFSFIFAIVILMQEIYKKWIYNCFYGVSFIGIMINIIMVYMQQRMYRTIY